MSTFPLYSTLANNLPEKDLTLLQKREFINKIAKFDANAHELLYVLIKCFFIENNPGYSLESPYNGKFIGKDMQYNLLDLPFKLRQLLYKFLKLHEKSLREPHIDNNGQESREEE